MFCRRSTLIAILAAASFAHTIGSAQAQSGAAPASKDLVVFAAASLKNALDEVKDQWRQATGKKVSVSYAASSALAKQIEQGAPADIFVSADLDWMDYLAGKQLIKAGSRANLLGNRIVLIAPKSSSHSIDLNPGVSLVAPLGDGRLAMANVDAVPAGKYGKAALQFLGAWEAVSGRLAQAENVRAALLLVSRGEAPLGIVYQTDAAADPSVRIVGTFPPASHPPIVYPIAAIANSQNPEIAAFMEYVASDKAKAIFEAQGFTVVWRQS